MEVRIHKRADEDVAALVNWSHIEPYWLKSNFALLNRDMLVDTYSALWFDRTKSIFQVGEIFLQQKDSGDDVIMFCNGRHRTNLIIKHQQNLVPIAFQGGVPNHSAIQNAIVRELAEGEVVSIPDLPIMDKVNHT